MANSVVKQPFHSDVRLQSRLMGQDCIFWWFLGNRERISGTHDPIEMKLKPVNSSWKVRL